MLIWKVWDPSLGTSKLNRITNSSTSSTSIPILNLPSSNGARFSSNELVEEGNITEIVEKTLAQLSLFSNKDRTIQDEDDVLITRSALVTPRNLFQ